MAAPRVFVSSTYYDLKHIRASLEVFITGLGFEPILSEAGDIAYDPELALDESCYREAGQADIFVLIIGGHYGSEISATRSEPAKRQFFEQYESITKKEFETAKENNIPSFVLIEANVYAEYKTFSLNKTNQSIKYAHAQSVGVFQFIDEILGLRRNNPFFAFERTSQIENWLRDQWSGLFRELLRSRSQQKQLLALTARVNELQEINETLKNYLEKVLAEVSPTQSEGIIQAETSRLRSQKALSALKENPWYQYLTDSRKFPETSVVESITRPKTAKEARALLKDLDEASPPSPGRKLASQLLKDHKEAKKDFNDARSLLGLSKLRLGPSRPS